MCSAKTEKLPWPLDVKFFEYIYDPEDWKYQVFLKSKMEFKNFKRYALLYGLEFNRVGFKLSYVKTENDKQNDIYHLLAMLGIKIKNIIAIMKTVIPQDFNMYHIIMLIMRN